METLKKPIAEVESELRKVQARVKERRKLVGDGTLEESLGSDMYSDDKRLISELLDKLVAQKAELSKLEAEALIAKVRANSVDGTLSRSITIEEKIADDTETQDTAQKTKKTKRTLIQPTLFSKTIQWNHEGSDKSLIFKKDGKLQLLKDKERASDFNVNQCTSCLKVLGNKGGLWSHQQHCKLFLKEQSLKKAQRYNLSGMKDLSQGESQKENEEKQEHSGIEQEVRKETNKGGKEGTTISAATASELIDPLHVCCGTPCTEWGNSVVKSNSHICINCSRRNHPGCGTESEWGMNLNCKPSCEVARQKATEFLRQTSGAPQCANRSQGKAAGVTSTRSERAANRTQLKATSSETKRKGRIHRCSYTLARKVQVINLVEDLHKRTGEKWGTKRKVADLFDIPESNIKKWIKEKVQIFEDYNMTRGSKGRGNRGKKNAMSVRRGLNPKYSSAEQIVYDKILETRSAGGRVSGHTIRRWMRTEVKKELEQIQQMGLMAETAEFKASNRWLSKFVRRFNLSLRRKTNCKNVSITDRLEKVKRFHARLKLRIQRNSNEPGRSFDNYFGRWTPEHRLNVDQVPCPLECAVEQTYDNRGTKTVHIRSKGPDASKRFCTFQVCMRLTSNKLIRQPPLGIIFRGTGKRISKNESEGYDARVHVEFQPKAWADTEYSLIWIDRTLRQIQEDLPGESVLFLDNLSSQTSDEFVKMARKRKVRAHFLPSNCTDLIQPVDHHIGVNLKRYVGIEMEKHFEQDREFEKRWLGTHDDGPLSLSERRIVITKWAAQAWEDLCRNMDFGAIGFSTGCNMTINDKWFDTTANKEMNVPPIKIDGIEKYSFADIEITDYPENSDEEMTDDESDKEETGENDEFEVESGSEADGNEELDDTDFVDVDLPSEGLIKDYKIVEEYPGLNNVVGKIIFFKLNSPDAKREPGWYIGKITSKVTSVVEKAQGYNFNIKFTKSTTRPCASPFSGVIAVLLNKETYGINKQFFFATSR